MRKQIGKIELLVAFVSGIMFRIGQQAVCVCVSVCFFLCLSDGVHVMTKTGCCRTNVSPLHSV